MLEITSKKENGKAIVYPVGRVDSANADILDAEIEKADTESQLVLDVEKLEYMSSAGLRILLKYRKKHADFEIINASTDLYEIFDMTGFTEMINIKKAYKQVSVDGCQVIGQGANGKVYRIDPDTVVKVYINPDSLSVIQNERDVARKALVLGIPTAISYDIVKVGDKFASMFEMLDAKSVSQLLAENPNEVDKYSKIYVDLLKLIHSTEVPAGQLPSQKDIFIKWIKDLKSALDEETYNKAMAMAMEIPEDNHMLHGDYHTNNIMMQKGEAILIDMDTLAVGHPILEIASVYNAFIGFHILNPEEVKDFLMIDFATAKAMWENTLKLYYGTEDKEILDLREKQAKAIGYIRLMRRTIRRDNDPTLVAFYKDEIVKLIKELKSFI